ncbi:MAG: zinc ABC transporter ATP-binding protein ZnuC [Pseudomonadales bacterium]|nr:zinc ABC transporter ATP-binding protein ZnuC [Pseudomonadales bacterium]
MPDSLLRLNDMSLHFGEKSVLEHVSLSLKRGEITTLIGPNGAGKSSLVRIALGLLKPSSGEVIRQTGLRLGYMPQKLVIDDSLPLTVLRFLQLAHRSNKSTALNILSMVEGQHLAKQAVQKLSGGEFQRVLLARAILRKPDLLVLDEPVQGVDMSGQRELYRLITRVRDEFNCGVLMVSHDLHLVMKQTDHVICLNRHVCCAGLPENISNHPAYLQLFGQPEESELAIYTHHHDHQHGLSGDACSDDSHEHDGEEK